MEITGYINNLIKSLFYHFHHLLLLTEIITRLVYFIEKIFDPYLSQAVYYQHKQLVFVIMSQSNICIFPASPSESMGTNMPQINNMKVMFCPSPRFVGSSYGLIGGRRAFKSVMLTPFPDTFVELG